MTAMLATIVVLLVMAGEMLWSRGNERELRRQGAAEPSGDVYRAMAWVYPLSFVAIGIEGALRGRPASAVLLGGLTVFLVAKALKYWAIASLGSRWTFRVLVPKESTLIRTGPYAFVRHPNYVAVLGEIIGFALFAGAIFSGIAGVLVFGALLRRRVRVEERALGLADPGPRIPDPGRYT